MAAEPAGPRLVWSLPAGTALATPEAIVLWAPDFRSVLGVDALGRRSWRVATGDQGGFRSLERVGSNVLAWAGNELVLIAPKTGKILGRQPNVSLGAPGTPGCRFEQRAGACAIQCPCSFLPVRCEDLAPVAARASIPRFEEWDTEGNRRSECMGRAGALVGRAGDVTVVELPSAGADPKSFGLQTDLVGLDVHSAKERWRSHALVDGLTDFDAELSGADAGGGACWLANRSGALRVFDCQRATLSWNRKLSTPAGAEPQVEPVRGGLVVRDGTKAKRFGFDGRLVWEVDVAASELILLTSSIGAGPTEPPGFVWPRSAALSSETRRIRKLSGAAVLDPDTGKRMTTVTFPPGVTRWPMHYVPPGQAVPSIVALGDDQFTTTSLGGTTSPPVRSAAPIADLALGSTLVVLRTRDSLTARGLADARTVPLPADVSVLVEGLVGERRVLVLKNGAGPWDPKDPKSFGELRLYDLGRD